MSDQKNKKLLVREYGRECSLFRVKLLDELMTYRIEDLVGAPIEPVLAICRDGGMVYGYHSKDALQDIFIKVGNKAKDRDWSFNLVKKTEELFQWLEPYYDNNKSPQDIDELKLFHDKYREYVLIYGMVLVIPMVETLPEDIKSRAMKLREKVQEYNESPEIIWQDTLEKLYPQYKGKTRFVFPDEVWSGEISKPSIKQKISERQKSFIMYNGKFYSGIDVDTFLDKQGIVLSDQLVDKNVKEIKGQIAQKGKVKGRVKIIGLAADIDKVQKGDILVATMTMPRYIVAMKKAAAFVTDEGGVTCHAAIIAREMKKPCVIGTKIATQVLNDGDEVEVDANQGVVKILEK